MLLLSLSAVWCPSVARAEDAPRLGKPWEVAIAAGVREQEQLRRRGAFDAIVDRAERERMKTERDVATRVVRHYLLGRAYALRAASQQRHAEGLEPGDGQATCLRRAREDLEDARRMYGEALAVAPDCYLAWHDLGIVHLKREPPRTGDAVHAFEQAILAHPRYPAALRRLAVVEADRRHWGAARRALEALLQLVPEDREAKGRLAISMLRAGELDDAARHIAAQRRAEADEPIWIDLTAQLYVKQGKRAEAMKLYRRLAEAHPTHATPLLGYIDVLQREQQAGRAPPLSAWSWAIGRLARIERDPKRKAELIEQLREIERLAGATEAARPPTPEALVRTLREGAEAERFRVLVLLDGGDAPPPGRLLREVVKRVASASEPSPHNRLVAVRLLARHGRVELMPILRMVARDDPDGSVRVAASDGLERMGERSSPARALALLSLAMLREHADTALAASARLGILRLSRARLPDAEATSEAESATGDARHRRRFERWWAGPQGRAAVSDALVAYARARDKWPEQVLRPWVEHADPHLGRLAALAWDDIRRQACGSRDESWYRTRPGYARWRTWLDQMPPDPVWPSDTTEGSSVARAAAAWRSWMRQFP